MLIRVGSYARLSLAPLGPDGTRRREKVDRQLADNRARAARLSQGEHEWRIGDEYVDNHRSAWRRDGPREDWDRLLADWQAGHLDAVMVWNIDRLLRQPWDLEQLIRMVEDTGRRLLLSTESGVADLADAEHRYDLRGRVNAACRESDRNSARSRRAHAAKAGRGEPQIGRYRAYGWTRDGVIIPEEAVVIREMAGRVMAGDGGRGIAIDMQARGVSTVTGAPWRDSTIREILAKPLLAGLRVHHGQVVSAPSTWPPILKRATWEAVQAAYRSRAPAVTGDGRTRKFLLSGICRCGTCDAPMYVRQHRNSGSGQVNYQCVNPHCPKPRVTRSMRRVDDLVIGAVLALLADERVVAALSAEPEPDQPAGAAELAALEQRRHQTLAAFGDPVGDPPPVLAAALESIDERMADLRTLADRQVRRRVIAAGPLTRDEWDALTLDVRRRLVRSLVTVAVLPGRRGVWDPASVRIEPAYAGPGD